MQTLSGEQINGATKPQHGSRQGQHSAERIFLGIDTPHLGGRSVVLGEKAQAPAATAQPKSPVLQPPLLLLGCASATMHVIRNELTNFWRH
jgi:hypothetical protein